MAGIVPSLEIASEGTGDVLIRLKVSESDRNSVYFLVSSTILCTASTVFRAMLGPSSSFSEAVSLRSSKLQGKEPYVLQLFDDDPVALAIILNAIHLQTSKVPRDTTYHQLMKLASVCDKYDCAASVRVWAEIWMKPWMGPLAPHDMLFITWVFGTEDQFAKLTKSFIAKIAFTKGDQSDKRNDLVWSHGHIKKSPIKLGQKPSETESHWKSLSDQDIPDAVIDAMVREREHTINSILAICKTTLENYSNSSVKCRHSGDTEQCDNIILGSLYKALRTIDSDILSFDPTTIWARSIYYLVNDLKGIKITYLDYYTYEPHGNYKTKRVNHSATCDVMKQILHDIDVVVDNIRPLSLASFRKTKAETLEETKWETWEEKIEVSRGKF